MLLSSCGTCSPLFGDRCEALCRRLSERLEVCLAQESALDWPDLGANSAEDFSRQCRDGWENQSSDLTSNELEQALQTCVDTCGEVRTLEITCDELVVLYAAGV